MVLCGSFYMLSSLLSWESICTFDGDGYIHFLCNLLTTTGIYLLGHWGTSGLLAFMVCFIFVVWYFFLVSCLGVFSSQLKRGHSVGLIGNRESIVAGGTFTINTRAGYSGRIIDNPPVEREPLCIPPNLSKKTLMTDVTIHTPHNCCLYWKYDPRHGNTKNYHPDFKSST